MLYSGTPDMIQDIGKRVQRISKDLRKNYANLEKQIEKAFSSGWIGEGEETLDHDARNDKAKIENFLSLIEYYGKLVVLVGEEMDETEKTAKKIIRDGSGTVKGGGGGSFGGGGRSGTR